MTREEYRDFFADVKLCLNMSLANYLDRNHIFRSEFSNFMKKGYNNITDEELKDLYNDILDHIIEFSKTYKKIA